MWVLLHATIVFRYVVKSLGELNILGERMDTNQARPLAMGTVALDGHALFLAFGFVFVQRRRNLHVIANGSAMTV